jgi:hypothetical protein
MRNLNYSILAGELENENALEDMHMFFVAFHKRSKRIVEQAEVEEIVEQVEESKEQPNSLEKMVIGVAEIDLE